MSILNLATNVLTALMEVRNGRSNPSKSLVVILSLGEEVVWRRTNLGDKSEILDDIAIAIYNLFLRIQS